MSNTIKTTGDNSPTLYSSRFQAHYHSIHGAWTETDVVFIKSGLEFVAQKNKNLKILEIGFGTGLNCLATIQYADHHGLHVEYTTLEKFPIDKVVVEDFGAQLNSIAGIELQKYNQIHQADWNKTTQLSTNFQLNKLEIDFFDIPINKKFDLIYFDAFAPETQPELWTVEMFELMAKVLVKDGVLTTYCAKGYVKRNLRSAGFIVEALPGPPGKREITRAIKM